MNNKIIVGLMVLAVIGSYIHLNSSGKTETNIILKTFPTTGTCLSYLPYNILNNPEVDYYNWYGL